MSRLAQVCDAVAAHNRRVENQAVRARTDAKLRSEILARWEQARAAIPQVELPTGLKVPRIALPQLDEPGEIARYLHGEGLPGEFPYVNSAYAEMYLDPLDPHEPKPEEPTRLFSGLGLAEETNARFRYLSRHQRSYRLSTAFDGPTLYGLDSDADGVAGKIGEGGVAIDTVEDMLRLYDGFPLGDADCSVSMTISGPAPILMAMYIAAAKRRFGPQVVPQLRGTVQADILKEVQAQNEAIFPVGAALGFLCDMIEWTSREMPRWYPISISGYHIAEAGATPVQQAAYTLSNGFAYVEMLAGRGLDVDLFGPRLSFFLDSGLDLEYLALARVCRKLWAIGMRDVFGAGAKAQLFKLHTQTSGRSLIAAEFKNNLTRTALELMLAYVNATNSCHSNSADEPFTTPSEEWSVLASHAQSILLEESGLFRHMMNALSGSPGMKVMEQVVAAAILEEFRTIEEFGGVLGAMENRYQRTQIQASAHAIEGQISSGLRPIVGLTRYANPDEPPPRVQLVRTSTSKKRLQLARLKAFKTKHAAAAKRALTRLGEVVDGGGNVFAELLNTVECCTLGQITACLQERVGKFRPMV
ncbi:MAG: methylmalonyl-CoA mutase family protein [Bryobacteraceae bacterium]